MYQQNSRYKQNNNTPNTLLGKKSGDIQSLRLSPGQTGFGPGYIREFPQPKTAKIILSFSRLFYVLLRFAFYFSFFYSFKFHYYYSVCCLSISYYYYYHLIISVVIFIGEWWNGMFKSSKPPPPLFLPSLPFSKKGEMSVICCRVVEILICIKLSTIAFFSWGGGEEGEGNGCWVWSNQATPSPNSFPLSITQKKMPVLLKQSCWTSFSFKTNTVAIKRDRRTEKLQDLKFNFKEYWWISESGKEQNPSWFAVCFTLSDKNSWESIS